MSLQRTVRKEVKVTGIGVHSGQTVDMVIRPAAPDSGIVFVRTDLADAPQIPAKSKNVFSTQLATTLANKDRVRVGTVEHLLAAFHGLGIDNALVEVSGQELPVLDGSAIGFVRAIQTVGIEQQLKAKTMIALKKRVQLRVGDKWAVAEPLNGFEVRASIEWDHPVIGYQEFHYREGKTAFDEIANARTFGFLNEVEMLKKMGLARGGSLDNAIVLDQGRVLNPSGLRHPDEFVRHKILDALGDFKLAGHSFLGSFRLHRPGHELHHRLLSTILSDASNYEVVTSGRADTSVPDSLVAAFAAV